MSYLEQYKRIIRVYEPKDLGASTLSFSYIYCLGFYPESLGLVDRPSTLWTGSLIPESSAVVHTGHIYNTSDLLHLCLIEQTQFCRILTKQALQLQVQHHLWFPHPDKGVTYSMTNLMIWLQTFRVLPSIHRLQWPIQPTSFLPMILTLLQQPTAVTSVFLQAILPCKLSAIKWLSRRRKEERKVPSSSPQTTLLPLRHWSLDLVQQELCSEEQG